MPRKHMFVDGVVQGVGFRYYTVRCADELGVAGWTRNLRDGRVEIEAQADAATLDAFLAAVRRGPAFARVDSVEVSERPEIAGDNEFRVRFG